jgi:hypothetical protein
VWEEQAFQIQLFQTRLEGEGVFSPKCLFVDGLSLVLIIHVFLGNFD